MSQSTTQLPTTVHPLAHSLAHSERPRGSRSAWCGTLACIVTLALGALGCGGDIEARMAEVRALQDVGQFTASIEELREILAVAPDLPEATYRLGVALVQTGEPSRAVWALEKAAESNEYAIPASLLLASAHFGAQNFEATVDAVDRVLELDPERLAALRMRAKANLGAGRLDEAMRDTERLLETYPDDYAVHVLYATLLADLGRIEEAKEAHDRVKELALASEDTAISHRGCLAPAIFARDKLNDMDKAEELFEDCIERFPTNAFVASEVMKFYDRIRKHEKATELIRQAVEQAPENLSMRSHLAMRLRNMGEVEEAEQVLLEAAESFRSAGAWNLLAGFYRQQGESAKALEALEKMADLAGGGTDQLRFTQADVLIDVGELDRAEEIARSLEEPIYAKLLRGRIALERGDPKGALELFDQGIRAWPNNAGARFLAGLAARALGDRARAISELREAVRVDNSATSAAELLARIHFELGDYAEAIRYARLAARRRGAELPGIYVVAARALVELRKYDEARMTLENLSRMSGQESLATIELASVESAASGPAAGVRTIEESGLDLGDPQNADLLRAYADHRIAEGKAELALERIDAALARHPSEAAYHEMRGLVLTRLDRDQEAHSAFEKSAELDPQHAGAYAGLATLAARGNEIERAVELFDQAAGLAPDKSSYAYAAAQLSLATGAAEGAEKRLREVVSRFPGHAGARNDLAWILAEKGEELDWALALAEEAQRMDPSPDVLDTLGWVHFRRGEMSAAVGALEQAVEARADSPSIRYRLGVALNRAGDPERAREMLEEAIAVGSFPEAADARRELAELEKP
jgi:tetratricopeptide (TPR) repeat protein